MTTDNFCFYLQNTNPIQAKGGQWYRDTSPFSIPCLGITCFININQASYLQSFIFFAIYEWPHVSLSDTQSREALLNGDSTVDLLVLNSLDQFHFIEKIIYLFCKMSYLNEEVNCTEPSPSVSVPCPI